MKEPIKIAELDKWLSDLPEIIKYKDGEEVVECRLTFYFHKSGDTHWTAAYYCREYDYFVCHGFGDTLIAAVKHLRRVLKDFRKRKGEGYVGQI